MIAGAQGHGQGLATARLPHVGQGRPLLGRLHTCPPAPPLCARPSLYTDVPWLAQPHGQRARGQALLLDPGLRAPEGLPR